jgi:MFS family permease
MSEPAPLRSAALAGAPAALPALIVGQVGLHAAMAGLRMATPLQALHDGAGAWAVGVLMALFAAAPMALALAAGRMADRHGYHRPVRLAVALTLAGGLAAVGSTLAEEGTAHRALLALAAAASGAGANLGLIAIQRTGALLARNAAERVRVFSWLGIAPSLANVIGPVGAGFAIDLGGFRAAYALLLLLPLVSGLAARAVPRAPPQPARGRGGGRTWDLLRVPGLRRLLAVNWLLSTFWDVHAFAVPILGHERGFAASTIGLVLGTFTFAVTAVRLVIPLLAHRLQELQVVRGAMIGTALGMALYPLAPTPWPMAACAATLGLALGCVQPMIMSTLHRLTPDGRHGEALALRSMAINASSTVMPLLFGAAGAAVGAAAMFWVVGAAVGAGSRLTGRLAQGAADRVTR